MPCIFPTLLPFRSSDTPSIWPLRMTEVLLIPVSRASCACAQRNEYSPCTGRKCCGFTSCISSLSSSLQQGARVVLILHPEPLCHIIHAQIRDAGMIGKQMALKIAVQHCIRQCCNSPRPGHVNAEHSMNTCIWVIHWSLSQWMQGVTWSVVREPLWEPLRNGKLTDRHVQRCGGFHAVPLQFQGRARWCDSSSAWPWCRFQEWFWQSIGAGRWAGVSIEDCCPLKPYSVPLGAPPVTHRARCQTPNSSHAFPRILSDNLLSLTWTL